MSLLIQLVQFWKSPNSGILGVFVGNFQSGSNLTQKMPLYYSIFRYFCSKNRTSRNFHHLSTFLILFLKKLIIIVFSAILPISFLIGVKHQYCHVHHYCHICVPYSPLLIISKRGFLPETSITFPVILVTKA